MKIRLKEINHAHSFHTSDVVEGLTLDNKHFLAEIDHIKKIFTIHLSGSEVFKRDAIPKAFEYCNNKEEAIQQLLGLSRHYNLDLEEDYRFEPPPFELSPLFPEELSKGLPVYLPSSQENGVPKWEYGHILGVIETWEKNDFGELEIYFRCANSSKSSHCEISNLWIIN